MTYYTILFREPVNIPYWDIYWSGPSNPHERKLYTNADAAIYDYANAMATWPAPRYEWRLIKIIPDPI